MRIDAALAAIVIVEALFEACLTSASWPARLATAGPAAVVAAGALLYRRRPIAAVAIGAVGLGLVGLLVQPIQTALAGLYLAWLALVYAMAVRETGGRLLAGVGVALAGLLVVFATMPGGHSLADLAASTAVFVIAPVFAGNLLNSRIQLNRALREKAARFEELLETQAQAAVTGERRRIAGELHDVVSHALGAMTIQATAARRLAASDAPRAAGSLEAVETTGREALGELRTLLGVLRAGEPEQAPHEPQPSLASLADLAGRERIAGLPVEIEVSGERPQDLTPSVDLTAYRVVQEALEQARRHGDAGNARVSVRYLAVSLEVEVVDDGLRASDRHLLGLHERVRLYGGEIDAGPRAEGGHVVRASLPLEGVPA